MKKLEILILAIFLVIGITVSYLLAAGTLDQLRPVTVPDMGGPPMVGMRAPGWTDAVVLTANTATSHTKPTGANYVLFSSTANFYVSYIGTASIPSVHTTSGLACELNPVLRNITDVTALSLISPISCIVTMGFWK